MEKMTKNGKKVSSIKKEDQNFDNYEELSVLERAVLTVWVVILVVVTFYFWL